MKTPLDDLDQDKSGGVRSVERALAIVSILAEQSAPIALGDIASRMALHPSTVHRLLGTLIGLGWVEQEPDTSRYLLGPRLLGVSASVLASSTVVQQSRQFLVRLAELSGGNAYLSVLVGRRVTYLTRTGGELGPARHVDFEPGAVSHPLHTMADGKLLLAYQSSAEIEQFLDDEPLQRYTDATITDRDLLLGELETIRAQRYSVDRGERYAFQRGLAVPVVGRGGVVIASLLTWGRIELTEDVERRLSQEMAILADELSFRLGIPATPLAPNQPIA